MTVSLRELTRDTWHQCIDLQVREDQQDFVASNLYSIAEAQFYPGMVYRAIYADDTMIGFLMYGPDAEYTSYPERDGAYAIVRLMIDQAHQGKGYGRAVIEEVIRQLKTEVACRSVYLSFAPENHVAERLYRRLGFQPTGALLDGEVVFRLMLKE